MSPRPSRYIIWGALLLLFVLGGCTPSPPGKRASKKAPSPSEEALQEQSLPQIPKIDLKKTPPLPLRAPWIFSPLRAPILADSTKADLIIAKVNEQTWTLTDLDLWLRHAPRSLQMRIKTPKGRELIAANIVEALLFSQEATRKEALQTPTLRWQQRIILARALQEQLIANLPNPSNKTLSAHLKNNAAHFLSPERRSGYVIVVSDETNARELREQLLANPKAERAALFQIFARTHSLDKRSAKEGGKLPIATKGSQGELPLIYRGVLFAMAAGSISEPIPLRASGQFALLRLEEIQPGGTPPLKDIRARVLQNYQRAAQKPLLPQLLVTLRKKHPTKTLHPELISPDANSPTPSLEALEQHQDVLLQVGSASITLGEALIGLKALRPSQQAAVIAQPDAFLLQVADLLRLSSEALRLELNNTPFAKQLTLQVLAKYELHTSNPLIDQEVVAFYQKNIDTYRRPERRRFIVVTFPDEASASSAEVQLLSDHPEATPQRALALQALAVKQAKTPRERRMQGGTAYLTALTNDDPLPTTQGIRDEGFNLEGRHDLSAPFQDAGKWHLLMLNGQREELVRSFESIAPQIREQLETSRAEKQRTEKLALLKEKASNIKVFPERISELWSKPPALTPPAKKEKSP